jgi:hypothetical protein
MSDKEKEAEELSREALERGKANLKKYHGLTFSETEIDFDYSNLTQEEVMEALANAGKGTADS